jgi:ribose-phosphate pyrophosphokinase
LTGFDYAIANKSKCGGARVDITLPDREYNQQPVVGAGRTLSNTAKLLLNKGAIDIEAVITHALFCGDAE